MSALKEGLTLALILIALGCLLILASAAAGAGTLVRESGYQIHIHYTKPVDVAWRTIGPPFATKQLCEDIRTSIMLEFLHDRVVCRYVDELWSK